MAAVPGLTGGFKFTPDDDEVIELYLVPSLRRQPTALAGILIDADPLSAPPWKLFSNNGLDDDVKEAYFLAPGDATKNRKVRVCANAGTWVTQKLEKSGEVRIDGETFAWQKHRLNFHYGKAKSGSMGWVMHEYSVVAAPQDCASLKICHISFTGHGQKRKRTPDGSDCDGAATHHQLARAPPSSTTSATHDFTQVYNDATPPWTNEEPMSTAAHQFADPVMLPMVDLGSFAYSGFSSITSAAPAMEHGMMPLQIDQDCYQAPLATTTVDQSLPMVDLASFDFPGFSSTSSTSVMAHDTMPLQIYQETCVLEQSAEYGTEPMEKFCDVDDPELRQILESVADYATAAQTDAGFGDQWATAGRHYDHHHLVMPEQSFSTQHQVFY
jgi:hypothetical protein